MGQVIGVILIAFAAALALKLALIVLFLFGIIFRTKETLSLLFVLGIFAVFREHPAIAWGATAVIALIALVRWSIKQTKEAEAKSTD